MKQLYCSECDKVYSEMEDVFTLIATPGYCHEGHQMIFRDKK